MPMMEPPCIVTTNPRMDDQIMRGTISFSLSGTPDMDRLDVKQHITAHPDYESQIYRKQFHLSKNRMVRMREHAIEMPEEYEVWRCRPCLEIS